MSKRYNFEKIINNRYSVWYMNIPNGRGKLGVWKIIDLYSGTRATRFAFRWKVKGKEKTQEQLDAQILMGAVKRFYRRNIYRGNRYEAQQAEATAA